MSRRIRRTSVSRRPGPQRRSSRSPGPRRGTSRLVSPTLRRLAWLRYAIRRFLRFSEGTARACGVTPRQHQLLLGVAGFTGRGCATVSELAEFLQGRHNTIVGLVQRAETRGWVRKEPGEDDRRTVLVRLTARGETLLRRLARLHLEELRRIRRDLGALPGVRPRLLPERKD